METNAVYRVAQMYNLRPHLAIIWDEETEYQLDESDDESENPLFEPPGFRPGSAPLRGIPVQDGYKCMSCELDLREVCVTAKEGVRGTIAERKDLNQFGAKFLGYRLLEIIELIDIDCLLHKTKDKSFEVLRCLSLRMLEASREDTNAGFQPMLGKVMIGDPEKYNVKD
ncbi:hypothetical protein LIPSTDRAFT_4650 [Lipomyces starkeyi NRRL Y-11557]|uniref:Uncharacterized protein n=1 Tax=Lipomyces starkeyi NRRL Y-11557 TaxID=675824 RepID=A0A1E3Q158_LIPST|nr:hypothetical protein LIPSTDRAFT_4650 [Lipomyces starkeyi NRRL Y-11557]